MKTTFIRIAKASAVAAFMFIAFTTSAFAKPIEVSNYLSRQFEQQFRGASNVSWKITSQFTSATFMQNDQKVSVFYNTGGELVGVSRTIDVKDLPKKAQQVLNNRYSDHTVVSVIEFTDSDDVVRYYIQLENNNKQSILQTDELGSLSDFKN